MRHDEVPARPSRPNEATKYVRLLYHVHYSDRRVAWSEYTDFSLAGEERDKLRSVCGEWEAQQLRMRDQTSNKGSATP